MVDFCVKIVEIVAAPLVRVEKGADQQIDIRPSRRNDERGPVLAYRPLQGQLRSHQPDGAVDFERLHIAVLHGDLQYRRKAAAVARRKPGFCKLYILDGSGIKDREEAEEVGGVVHRGVVEQNKVLIRAAAPNVKAAHALRAGLNPWKKL